MVNENLKKKSFGLSVLWQAKRTHKIQQSVLSSWDEWGLESPSSFAKMHMIGTVQTFSQFWRKMSITVQCRSFDQAQPQCRTTRSRKSAGFYVSTHWKKAGQWLFCAQRQIKYICFCPWHCQSMSASKESLSWPQRTAIMSATRHCWVDTRQMEENSCLQRAAKNRPF